MKYYIANWKMNLSFEEINKWFGEFPGSATENIIIAPSFPYLPLVKEKGFKTCAQDVSVFERGARTGDIGNFQLKDFCDYCIVGHSERKESLETVLRKRDRCIELGITPVVCFVKIDDALSLYREGVILAWEDPQNISVEGKYNVKDPAEVRTNLKVLKATLPEGTSIVYGGSVNKENIKDLRNIEGLDGVLVGNASLDPIHFYEICES